MLSSFTLKNFKSYREATLELAPLTLLIGANASGKSNLIEALRLLSWIVSGNRLGSIRHALRDADCPIRGSVADLYCRNSHDSNDPPFLTLSCRTTDAEWNEYAIALERRSDDELHVYGESLTSDNEAVPLFEIMSYDEATGAVWVAYNNFARGGIKPQVPCNDREAVLLQLQSPARFKQRHEKIQKLISQISAQYQRLLSDITFFDPRPSVMRNYGNKGDAVLSANGKNLSGVIYNICNTTNEKSRFLDFIKDLPERSIRDIGFIETPRNEAMINITEGFFDQDAEYDATLLSDGTLRVLAIAASILSAPEGGMVVIEEIDNGVHPSRVQQLLNRLSSIARERNLRILLSSHNPALLDALPDDAMPNVVLCYRDPDNGSSRLTRLADMENYPEIVMQGNLGESMTRGVIEWYAKNQLGPEEREQRAASWLRDLREQVG